jgi:uncharacterized protein
MEAGGMEYSVTEFTPWRGLFGGALIGLSSGLMLLLVGRLTGISGIAAGVMTLQAREASWRLLFIIGLMLGALLYTALTGNPVRVDLQVGLLVMFIGGFLVGFGTRMGSGCTAGHGIVGISRLSMRSVVATATFFLTAVVTVYVVRHL